MKRILWLSTIAALAVSAPAFAADNATVKDAAGTTVTTASKDVAGVHFRKDICVTLADTTIDCFTELNAALLPEDTASANADTGLPVFAVRKATPANTSGTDGDYEALQINGGRLWTDAGALLPSSLGAKTGAGSLSVVPASDGFGVNASQTGTWNITNISGTISLPTGAATAAKQPALGTAGTASSDVITVQGISGGTNLNVACQSGCSGGTPYTEDAAAASDPQGIAIISRRRDTMTTAEVSADGDNIGLISTNKGELRINDNSLNAAVGTTADAASQSGASTLLAYTRSMRDDLRSLATDTTPLTVKTDQTTHGTTDLVAADITKVAGAAISQGNGTAATAIRVALPTDGTGVVGLNAGTNLVGKVGIDQTTPGTTNAVSLSHIGSTAVATGNGIAGTGVQRVTIASDNTAFSINCASGCSGGVQKTEDSVSASGDTGTIALAVQVASPSDLAADGDYAIPQMKSGRLFTSSDTTLAGVAASTGNGVSGTGVQRVTIASDSTGQVALAAGSATIGATYGFAGTATTTITRPANATSYTAGQTIANATSGAALPSLTGMCRGSGGSGIITDLFVLSNDTAALQGKVYVFDSTVTAANDAASEAISDADAAKLVAEIPFTLTGRAQNASAHLQNLNIAYTCSGGTTLNFFPQATGGTLTTVSGNVYTFRFKYIQTN